MRRATILTESLAAALIALCTALPSHAREVCEPAPDPAFAGSVSVDLTAAGRPLNELTGAPLAAGELTYQFTAGGVTFLFESLSGVPLDIAAGAGIVSRDFGPLAGMGFAVTVNPPVSAIGFRGYEFDGCPGAIYSGTGGTQGATLLSCNGGFPCPGSSTDPAFFGAADIGGVGAVHVWQPASIFVVTELVFVPPDVLPEETADLSVVKTEAGGDLLVLNGEPIRYRIDVGNSGPDVASDVLVSDFLPSGIFDDASHDGSGTGTIARWQQSRRSSRSRVRYERRGAVRGCSREFVERLNEHAGRPGHLDHDDPIAALYEGAIRHGHSVPHHSCPRWPSFRPAYRLGAEFIHRP